MQLPEHTFFLKKSDTASRLGERWYVELKESSVNLDKTMEEVLYSETAYENYTFFHKLVGKQRLAMEQAVKRTIMTSLFDMYQLEIGKIYKEAFRDGLSNDLDLEDPDVVDIKGILDEFYAEHPNMIVINLVPIDFDGTMGFVVMPKDMNP